jgi:ABC-2 type transport system permease protein
MWTGIQRELKYLISHKWDLSLVTIVPLFLIIVFGCMFVQGVPKHLPIAIIDQDHSSLSQNIERYFSLNDTLRVTTISPDQVQVEKLLNENKIWGYLHIPYGAEQRLVQGKDAEINMAYNQSYYSIGDMISSAMLKSTLEASANFMGKEYLENDLPYLNTPTPNLKFSLLFNPNFNYEFYLEPYLIPAIFHLLLSCCIAFSIGQELKYHTTDQWLKDQTLIQAILSKNLVYIAIFMVWTWIWMAWLIGFQGWFVAGHLWLIILAQFFFYTAYGLFSTVLVLATKRSLETFGLLAVYGGSSLSFAGVTLPVTDNAPLFTKFWSDFIPYTHYAKLQTEQWVIGSPIYTSMTPFSVLVIFCVVCFGLSIVFFKQYLKGLSR